VSERLGRYRILRPLGEGGMGRLFLGEAAGPSGFSRRVVVKLVKDELDAGLKQALLDEARLVASLVHRNLVPVLDLDEDAGQRLVVLEHVDGMDLRHLLDRKKTLPWPMAVFIASEVAAGLDYAHRKTDPAGRPLSIVHRDVSPQNILLSWEGEVKLTDFGVAKFARLDGGEKSGLHGNLGYMAPEQARGERVDGRADLFALGVVLHEALTGENPLSARRDATHALTMPPLPGRFPKLLVQALERMTHRDPEARFPTAASLRQALLDIPGQPKDPAQGLAALLHESKDGPALEADALLEAVLGGAGPLTVARKKPAAATTSARRPPRWVWLVAGALMASVATMIFVARHGIDARPVAAAPQRSASASREAVASRDAASPPVAAAPPEPAAPVERERARMRRGALSINAIPWAKIFLDDRALGHTPRQHIGVDAGRHKLRLVTAKGDVRSETVEVAAGKETRVSVDFARP